MHHFGIKIALLLAKENTIRTSKKNGLDHSNWMRGLIPPNGVVWEYATSMRKCLNLGEDRVIDSRY